MVRRVYRSSTKLLRLVRPSCCLSAVLASKLFRAFRTLGRFRLNHLLASCSVGAEVRGCDGTLDVRHVTCLRVPCTVLA